MILSALTACAALLAPLFGSADAASPVPSVQTRMTATIDEAYGQVVLREGTTSILRYNARRVEVPAGMFDVENPETLVYRQRYAQPRSNYIHPLYGLDGESLTHDWSPDHPHHRGIYWAWPEVGLADSAGGPQTGDLHALVGIFARPVGQPALESTETTASVTMRNLWLWQDEEPVVFERARITAHALDEAGVRAIDLELRFEALRDGVTLARRGTDMYGGLNTRLAKVAGQETKYHADPEGAAPRRAWSYLRGTWTGGQRLTTLAILEDPRNPDYPGDWIEYPDLPWFQPTFPRAKTRFALQRGEPLVLRYRYLVLPGAATPAQLHTAWDDFAAEASTTDH